MFALTRPDIADLVPRCLLLATLAAPWPLSAATLSHDLHVRVEPSQQRIQVTDRVSWPEPAGTSGAVRSFHLHEGLEARVLEDDASLMVTKRLAGPVPIERYRLKLPPGRQSATLVYGGRLHHGLNTVREGRGRLQQYTAGHVAPDGVYLDGNSYWHPRFDDTLVSFSLRVELPPGWQAVSQGDGQLSAPEEKAAVSIWKEDQPQDDIYLLANRFHVYRQATPVAEAMVFLRRPDPKLARRYLDATDHYLDLYTRLLGPYPYAKFALVENFWETGYGMPSFTLLGPRVIRLPFILHSSFPHEILHNWWGNGVYVDYAAGNWSEGLTAYLADHLVQEQRGLGPAYRRSALQKYADYVAEDRDFPLTSFRARHGEVSQAVGYNKALMLFHMLRLQLGDSAFLDGLRRFYADHQFRAAGYADLRAAFETVSDMSLAEEFTQWTERVGAPSLAVDQLSVVEDGDRYRVQGVLRQVQEQAPYRLQVPIWVQLQGDDAGFEAVIKSQAAEQAFDLVVPGRPLRLMVDSRFDVFRRLHPAEIPPSLGQLFGADDLLFVLPASASTQMQQAYSGLARSWGASKQDIVRDDQLRELPSDRPVWLLGWQNRFRAEVTDSAQGQDLRVSDKQLTLEDQRFGRSAHSVALVFARPGENRLALGWLAAHEAAAVAGLSRKLPHYGKYSYLAFSGNGPRNVLKGQWEVQESPLNIRLGGRETPAAAPPQRPPLTAATDAPRSAHGS